MQRQRDVAAPAPLRASARAAVDRAGDPATVEEQDCSTAALLHSRQLREQGRRQRVAGLVAQVDQLHRRHRRTDAGRQRQRIEPSPALRPRRRASVHGDRALESCALGSDGAGVVARVRLLLERGVVLLVDDDEPESGDGREHGRPCADHDTRLARCDSLALVTALGVAQRRVQHGDAAPEACVEPADRLRRQGDLGHEDDRAEPALEHDRTGLEIHLRLPASGRAVEEDVAASRLQCADDPRDCCLLLGRELRRLRLAGDRLLEHDLAPGASPRSHVRRNERERPRRCRAVVVGEPERELHERSWHALDDRARLGDLEPRAAAANRARRRRRGRGDRRAER